MKIIDNYFIDSDFKKITNMFESSICPWYYAKGVIDWNNRDNNNKLDDYFFCHMVYEKLTPQSNYFYDLIKILEPKNLGIITRIKCNLYPRTAKVNFHPWHTDSPTHKLRGALLMLNTCDGFTGFKDGTKVNSVANRMVLFDSSKEHHSTSTSDVSVRMTLNINYV